MVSGSFDFALVQVLYLYFGWHLLKKGYRITGEGPSGELQEVEEELVAKKRGRNEMDDENVDSKASGYMKGKRTAGEKSGVTRITRGFLQNLETETFKVFTQV
jgi:hypothetical protein